MLDIEVGRYAVRTFEFYKTLRSWPGSDAAMAASARSRSEWQWANDRWWPRNYVYRWGSPSYGRKVDDWSDGTCVAECRRGMHMDGIDPRHKAPEELCTCGIYASLSYADLLEGFEAARKMVTVIAAEGVTIIGDIGLRTECARVVAYWTMGELERKTAREQFVDAVEYESVSAMLDHYGIDYLPPARGRRGINWHERPKSIENFDQQTKRPEVR